MVTFFWFFVASLSYLLTQLILLMLLYLYYQLSIMPLFIEKVFLFICCLMDFYRKTQVYVNQYWYHFLTCVHPYYNITNCLFLIYFLSPRLQFTIQKNWKIYCQRLEQSVVLKEILLLFLSWFFYRPHFHFWKKNSSEKEKHFLNVGTLLNVFTLFTWLNVFVQVFYLWYF